MQIDKTPLVSVIVPAYNTEKYIEKCIRSLVGQTYKTIEVIIVNDGSVDQTKKCCEMYASKDKRVHVINKKNEGVTKARIKGFSASKGQFIMFVDADDYIHPQCVEKMVSAAIDYNVDMVGCQYFNVVKRKCERSVQRPKDGLYVKEDIIELLKKNFLYDDKIKIAGMTPFLWTKLIKRQFVSEALNAGIGLWYEEDLVGTLQLLYTINSMYITTDYLYYYVQHSEQTIKNFKPDIWNNEAICWSRIDLIDLNHYLSQQLFVRKLLTIFQILKMCSGEGYKVFIEFFKTICSSDVVRNLLDMQYYNRLNVKNKIRCYFLKKKLGTMLYFLFLLKR